MINKNDSILFGGTMSYYFKDIFEKTHIQVLNNYKKNKKYDNRYIDKDINYIFIGSYFNNFYHFAIQILPQIHIFNKSNKMTIYFSKKLEEYQSDIIKKLNINYEVIDRNVYYKSVNIINSDIIMHIYTKANTKYYLENAVFNENINSINPINPKIYIKYISNKRECINDELDKYCIKNGISIINMPNNCFEVKSELINIDAKYNFFKKIDILIFDYSAFVANFLILPYFKNIKLIVLLEGSYPITDAGKYILSDYNYKIIRLKKENKLVGNGNYNWSVRNTDIDKLNGIINIY
jgi:hypothetical protein